jgi:hypothetical protein
MYVWTFLKLRKEYHLSSQIELSRSIPHLQPESCQHDAMGLDAFSRSGSSSSVKSAGMDRDPYVPVNYFSQETCARLAAAGESAARCADAMDASAVHLEATYRVSNTQSGLDGCFDPERTLPSMAPPKKFYRAHWLSISLRLVYRWTQEAKSSCAALMPMEA